MSIGKNRRSVKHAKQRTSIKNKAKLFFEGDFEVKKFKILNVLSEGLARKFSGNKFQEHRRNSFVTAFNPLISYSETG